MTLQERIQKNLAALSSALPPGGEGAKALPMPSEAPPGAEGGAPEGAAPAPAPAPAAPAPMGLGDEEPEGEDPEGGKSFYDTLVEQATGTAAKSPDGEPAAVTEVPAQVLAQLVDGVLQRRLGPVMERLKSLEASATLSLQIADGQLQHAVKSAEAMGVIARQPATTSHRPGVAAGISAPHNPASARGSGFDGTPGPAEAFPLTESEVFKAVHGGLIEANVAQAWWNAGHPQGPAGPSINPPGFEQHLPANIVEAAKALG